MDYQSPPHLVLTISSFCCWSQKYVQTKSLFLLSLDLILIHQIDSLTL